MDGNRAVVVGTTRYATSKVYHNIWQVTFDDDGRCSEYIEWYLAGPGDQG